MIRWCRFFSRFEGRNIPQVSQPVETISDRQRTLNTLLNESNYTQDKISRVIRSYFFLSQAVRAEKSRENLSEDPTVMSSIEAITPFVKNMSGENLMLLIVNASRINVRSYEFWSEVQDAFIKTKGRLLDSGNAANVVIAFNKSELQDSDLWDLLEERLLNDILPLNELDPRAASDLIKAFGLSQKGGEALYDNLISIITSNIETVTALDISKLFFVHAKMKMIDPELLNILLDRFIVVDEETPPFIFTQIFATALELEAEQKYIDHFEKETIKRLPNLQLSNIALIVNSYGRYRLIDGKEIGDSLQFLKELEEFYAKNRESLLSGKNEYSLMTELKIFWGFARAGTCVNHQLWKDFAEVLSKSTVEIRANFLRQYKAEIEEFMKSQGIISN